MQRIAPNSFSCRSSFQALSSTCSNECAAEVPALFTSMSIELKNEYVWSTNLCTCTGLVTSHCIANTFVKEILWSCFSAFANTSLRRAHIETLAPSSSNALAVANPIPSLPPVTIATLSASPRCVFETTPLPRPCFLTGIFELYHLVVQPPPPVMQCRYSSNLC